MAHIHRSREKLKRVREQKCAREKEKERGRLISRQMCVFALTEMYMMIYTHKHTGVQMTAHMHTHTQMHTQDTQRCT